MTQELIDRLNCWVALQVIRYGEAFSFSGIPDDGSLTILAHPEVVELPDPNTLSGICEELQTAFAAYANAGTNIDANTQG